MADDSNVNLSVETAEALLTAIKKRSTGATEPGLRDLAEAYKLVSEGHPKFDMNHKLRIL